MNTTIRYQENLAAIGPSDSVQGIEQSTVSFWRTLASNADFSLFFAVQGKNGLPLEGLEVWQEKKETIYKSTDGGESWVRQDVNFIPQLVAVEASTVLVSSVSSGLYYDNPNPPIWPEGLQRSTNAGATWTQVLTGYVTALSMSGQNAVVIIGGEIKKSTDGGATWQTVSAPANQGPFTGIATGGGKILLTSPGTISGDPNLVYESGSGGAYLSNNFGSTWTQLKSTPCESPLMNRAGTIYAATETVGAEVVGMIGFNEVVEKTSNVFGSIQGNAFQGETITYIAEDAMPRILGASDTEVFAKDANNQIVVTRNGQHWNQLVTAISSQNILMRTNQNWFSVLKSADGLTTICAAYSKDIHSATGLEIEYSYNHKPLWRLSNSIPYRLPNFSTNGQLSLPAFINGAAVTSWSATGLPAWASFNATTGTISGDPKTSGTHNLTITATNSGGSLTFPLRIVVQPGLPALVSGQSFSGKVGDVFSTTTLQLASDTYERSFTGFTPANISGLSLASSGALSGTPTTAGSSARTVTLNGASGSTTGSFLLDIAVGNGQLAPNQSFNATVGIAFNATVQAIDTQNRPVTSWASSNLPAGLTINATSGVISGTPQDSGDFTATISATNSSGVATGSVSFSIQKGKPSVLPQTLSGSVGAPFTATVQAQDVVDRPVVSWAATNLPSWATFSTTTGTISGLPTTRSTTQVIVTATNSAGTSDGVAVSLAIVGGAPKIPSAITLRKTIGRPFQQAVTLKDRQNCPAVSWSATGLPPGVSISASTGILSGTPTQVGTFKPTISAVGESGATSTGEINFIVRTAAKFYGDIGLVLQPGMVSRAFASGLLLVQVSYLIRKGNEAAANELLSAGMELPVESKAIDGLYIYPEPEWSDAENGFTKISVTAYGRWKTEPNVTRQKRKLELAVYGQVSNMPRFTFVEGGPTGPVTVYFVQTLAGGIDYPLNKKEFIADDLVLSFVMPTNVNLPLIPPNSLSRLYQLNGELIPQMIDVNHVMGFFGGMLKWNYDNVGGNITINPAEYDSDSIGYNSFAPQESGVSLVLTRCESVEYGYFSEYTASFEATGTSFTKKALLFRKK